MANICKRCHREVRFLTEDGLCTICLKEIDMDLRNEKSSPMGVEVKCRDIVTIE